MVNSKFIKSTCIFVFSLWMGFSALAENLLRDPGFERTPDGKLPAWKGEIWTMSGHHLGEAEVISNSTQARSGEKYMKMYYEKGPETNNICMMIFDKFLYPAFPGKKYVMKVWARGSGEISIGVLPFDKVERGKSVGAKRVSVSERGSGWTELSDPEKWVEVSFDYIPALDHNFRLRLLVKGKIDVDDLSLEVSELNSEEKAMLESFNPQQSGRNPSPASAAVVSAKTSVANPDDVNGGFENWTASERIPSGWEVPGRLLPVGWEIEDRPGEGGQVRRVANSGIAALGNYNLMLDGRLVSKYIFEPVFNKQVQISLMAKGDGGKIKVRLRHYTGSSRNRVVTHVMEIVDSTTSSEWRRYAAKADVPSWGGFGPRVVATSIEIIGKGVLVDNLKADWSDARTQYGPVADRSPHKPFIYSVPISRDGKIAIDGEFSELKWSTASGANIGFLNSGGILVKRQAEYYLGADDTRLLICIRTPSAEALRQEVKERDGPVNFDDSYEIHINPTPGVNKPPFAYQFMVNALGTVYDARYENGQRLPSSKDWNCAGLEVASKVRNGMWTIEMAIPLTEIGLRPNSEFGFNLCRNLKNPTEDSNLTGHGYFDYDRMVILRLGPDFPAIFWGTTGEIGSGDLNLFARVSNHSAGSRAFEASFAINAEQQEKSWRKELDIPGASGETIHFATGGNPGLFGEIAVELRDRANKLPLVSHKVDFDTPMFLEQARTGNKILHYPTQKKLAVVLTPEQVEKAVKVEISVRRGEKLLQKTVTEKIETTFDKKTGRAMVDFTSFGEGKYLVSALVSDAAGNRLEYLEDDVVVKNLDWQGNNYGKGKINHPYTPLVAMDGKKLYCWGREYIFSGSGLPEQIVSQGEKVLSSPIAFACSVDGGAVKYGRPGKFEISSLSDEAACFNGETLFENFKVAVSGRLEYDGALFYHISVIPEKGVSVANLHFEMPFRDLRYFHTSNLWINAQPDEGEYLDENVRIWTPNTIYVPVGLRKHNTFYFPREDGTIWTSRYLATQDEGFLPYLTFGNTLYGLCWFAENASGWSGDQSKPFYEIIRKGKTSNVKVNLISAPLNPGISAEISFALAATPVRPRKTGLNIFDINVIGWHHSFTDEALGGLGIKDNYLFDKYLVAVDPKGIKPPFHYVCKSYMALGNPVFRYFYNEWHTVPERSYNSRGSIPVKRFGLDPDSYFAPAVCLYPERIDYMAYRIEELIRDNPRLRGIYWDENYSVPCRDISHRNCGYRTADGKVHPGLHTYGLREMDKRTQAILQKHNRAFPKLLAHTTAMIPPLLAFTDMNLCAERGTYDLNFIEYWELPRIENAAAGAWGIDISWIPQWGSEHGGGSNTLANNRSMLAALKLFDLNIWHKWCMPAVLQKFRDIEIKFGIAEDDSMFFGYWQKENRNAVKGLPVFVKAGFFVRPDKGVLLYVSNLDKTPLEVRVAMDFSRWGIDRFRVIDAETGKEIKKEGKTILLDVGKHDFRNLLIEKAN